MSCNTDLVGSNSFIILLSGVLANYFEKLNVLKIFKQVTSIFLGHSEFNSLSVYVYLYIHIRKRQIDNVTNLEHYFNIIYIGVHIWIYMHIWREVHFLAEFKSDMYTISHIHTFTYFQDFGSCNFDCLLYKDDAAWQIQL